MFRFSGFAVGLAMCYFPHAGSSKALRAHARHSLQAYIKEYDIKALVVVNSLSLQNMQPDDEQGPEIPLDPEPECCTLWGLTADRVPGFDPSIVPFGEYENTRHVYVVWIGRRPGLYWNWYVIAYLNARSPLIADRHDAHATVNRFHGCLYGKYCSLKDAQIAWPLVVPSDGIDERPTSPSPWGTSPSASRSREMTSREPVVVPTSGEEDAGPPASAQSRRSSTILLRPAKGKTVHKGKAADRPQSTVSDLAPSRRRLSLQSSSVRMSLLPSVKLVTESPEPELPKPRFARPDSAGDSSSTLSPSSTSGEEYGYQSLEYDPPSSVQNNLPAARSTVPSPSGSHTRRSELRPASGPHAPQPISPTTARPRSSLFVWVVLRGLKPGVYHR